MFVISELSPTRYSYSIMCSADSHMQVIDRPSESMIDSITNARIDYMCYLLAETMCVEQSTDNINVKNSAQAWIRWAEKKIGVGAPGVNFHVLLSQWLKCCNFLRACPVGEKCYQDNYALAMSFLLNWQDDSQPILINHISKAA